MYHDMDRGILISDTAMSQCGLPIDDQIMRRANPTKFIKRAV